MSEHEHSDRWIAIRPIADDAFRAKVWEAQVEDSHDVFNPQYAFTKGDDIMGAFSIMRAPVPVMWFRRGYSKAPDSMRAIQEMMNLLRCQGYGSVIWQPANPDFDKLMPGLGYKPMTGFWGRPL